MWLFFGTQYNSSLSSFVPNFRILTQVVAEKSLTEKNVRMFYIRMTEGKNEKLKKEGKMRKSILNFIYTIHYAYLKVYTNLKTLAPIGVEKSVTEISIGKKEKITNKGTNLQYVAVFVTQYKSSLSSFVPNFRILSQVVAEKSLTEKVYKQTSIVTEKAKTSYPLYTS